jgi:ATP-binding cassette subfamily G (WHITE) protein 2 (SNQ2)
MVTSLFLAELPWNILGSSIYYLCWFWAVGFPEDRAGFTYLMMGVAFPMYYTSNGMAVAAMAPNAEMAAVLFSVLFAFVLTFNGVMQPFTQLGWWKWMYHVSPFTYLIEAIVGQAFGKQNVTCATVEYVKLDPPSGQTCGSFLQQYISNYGGYLNNSDATSACEFCASATTDQYLGTNFNMHYSHHWRNFGLVMVYVMFNIFCIYAFTWFFRMRRGSIIGSLKNLFRGRKN